MKKFMVILLSLAMVFAVVGCTKEDEKKPEEKEKFVVGMEVDSAPFNYQLSEPTNTSVAIETGYADGYDVMMAKAIADALGRELVIKKIVWEGLIPALVNGEIDAIIGDMTATEEREKSVDFTTPYYDPGETGEVIIVKENSPYVNYTDIQQFSGVRLIAQFNTINDEAVDLINGVIHVTPKATYPLLVLALQQDEAEGIVCSRAEATAMMTGQTGLKVVTFEAGHGFDIDASVSIAMQEGTRGGEFFNAVQKALDNISNEQRDLYMVDAIAKMPVEE